MEELEYLREKVRLLERIAELERQLANPPPVYIPYIVPSPTVPSWPPYTPSVTWGSSGSTISIT